MTVREALDVYRHTAPGRRGRLGAWLMGQLDRLGLDEVTEADIGEPPAETQGFLLTSSLPRPHGRGRPA